MPQVIKFVSLFYYSTPYHIYIYIGVEVEQKLRVLSVLGTLYRFNSWYLNKIQWT
jgi:hypothetical protein